MRPTVNPLRTTAWDRKDQWTHPVSASSEYTYPAFDETYTRPSITACPYSAVAPGKPNAHLSVKP